MNPYDLTVFCRRLRRGVRRLLWWNAAGGHLHGRRGRCRSAPLALLGLTTNTSLLIPLICGINVIEIGSVALQMAVFRASGRKRRLFRISPIHHHFEQGGWAETKVIIRFWLISGMSVAGALAIYFADFTHQTAGG